MERKGVGMKYKEALHMKCSCGSQCIGGWIGEKRNGKPCLWRVSIPIATEIGIMTEEHTARSCWKPYKIKEVNPDLLSYLHSKGVVIKKEGDIVVGKAQYVIEGTGYTLWEPLIKE